MKNLLPYRISLAAAIAIIIFTQTGKTEAQTCGFGCLGLGGFYAGYTIQQYKADGLNNYIRQFNSENALTSKEEMPEFGRAQGFRLGANVFRTNTGSFLMSAKVFYQYLKENHNSTESLPAGNQTTTFSLNLNYYSVGVDMGFQLWKLLDWKFIDLGATYHTADFNPKIVTPQGTTIESNYTNSVKTFGYSVGTGLIFHVVANYISLEVTGGYMKFSIDQVQNDNGRTDSKDVINNFVNNGGLYGTAQLNVGIPLY